MTNENVCVSGFQRFGFEPEPGSEPEEVERILKKSRTDFVVIDDPLRTGSEPSERVRLVSSLAWFMACDVNSRPKNARGDGARAREVIVDNFFARRKKRRTE